MKVESLNIKGQLWYIQKCIATNLHVIHAFSSCYWDLKFKYLCIKERPLSKKPFVIWGLCNMRLNRNANG